MKKDEKEKKFVVLDFLNEVYGRWFQGKASDEEKKIVEKSNEIIRKGNLPDMSKEAVTKIREDVYGYLSDYIRKEKRTRQAKRMLLYTTSVAAVLAMCFCINTTLFQHLQTFSSSKEKFVRVDAGNGTVKQIELADGTKISMNQDTHIEYRASEFNKKQREIWLNGEAFFDVAKNPQKPFIIHSGDFCVKVLGTAFNIKSYSNLNQYIVSVRRGKVNVSKKGKNLGNLVKDKELAYNMQTNSFEISDKDCSEVDKWASGSLVLNNADKKELIFRMKQYYGVEVKVANTALSGVMINGVYDKSDSPEDVIKSICILYNIKYISNKGVITILP